MSLSAIPVLSPQGICISSNVTERDNQLLPWLEALALDGYIVANRRWGKSASLHLALRDECFRAWMPDADTTRLANELGLKPTLAAEDLEREILLALLAAPRRLSFPSVEELLASVRMRCNIVTAARKTQLAFHTSEAERPDDYWTYSAERGFIIRPGRSLITALIKATQPGASGEQYAFSCYRATEYVILLGIAQALAVVNPALLSRLETQWASQAIKSARFHDAFLYEYGSMADPLPSHYYVPGDRVWFRNPDPRSADITGYEGSWVFYLGNGQFSNFWQRDQPFTLTTKCVEIFHWRDGVYQDRHGEWQIDESVVQQRKQATLDSAPATKRVLAQMMRIRDERNVFAHGGCLDASREFPRYICAGTADIDLPEYP